MGLGFVRKIFSEPLNGSQPFVFVTKRGVVVHHLVIVSESCVSKRLAVLYLNTVVKPSYSWQTFKQYYNIAAIIILHGHLHTVCVHTYSIANVTLTTDWKVLRLTKRSAVLISGSILNTFILQTPWRTNMSLVFSKSNSGNINTVILIVLVMY